MEVAGSRVCVDARGVEGVSCFEQGRTGGEQHMRRGWGGVLGGVFHASASVSRWEKGRNGEYKRATIAGFCAPRGACQQGLMAYQRQARDSDEQDGANAQAIDRRLENERRASGHSGASKRGYRNPCSGAPLVAPPVSRHGDDSDVPVAGNSEKARIEHEAVAAGRGTQEFSGHLEPGAFAQYADAA